MRLNSGCLCGLVLDVGLERGFPVDGGWAGGRHLAVGRPRRFLLDGRGRALSAPAVCSPRLNPTRAARRRSLPRTRGCRRRGKLQPVDGSRADVDSGGRRAAGGNADRRCRPSGSLFLDAVPSREFRAFAKIKGDVRLTESPLDPNIALHELFADFTLADKAFFRLGKQTVNWGVGYSLQPGRHHQRRAHRPREPGGGARRPRCAGAPSPVGPDNFYTYAIVDGIAGDYRLALAPKVEFVFGRSEVGAGFYYRADRVPRAMATLSTSFGRLSLFGEAVLSKGSDKRFVREVPVSPDNPFGLAVVTDQDTVRFHGTAGAGGGVLGPRRPLLRQRGRRVLLQRGRVRRRVQQGRQGRHAPPAWNGTARGHRRDVDGPPLRRALHWAGPAGRSRISPRPRFGWATSATVRDGQPHTELQPLEGHPAVHCDLPDLRRRGQRICR